MRHDGRRHDELRPIQITRDFTATPAGSVLWKQGGTIVLCTASITQELPPWFAPDKPGGWITAEYVMLPATTTQTLAQDRPYRFPRHRDTAIDWPGTPSGRRSLPDRSAHHRR